MLCPVCLTPLTPVDGLTPLHRDTLGHPCPMSGREAWHWDERSTREAVQNRSGGICEVCRRERATDMHHRISRGVGGKWSPANILHLCRRCHSRVTGEDRQWGYDMGINLKHHELAELVPVKTARTLWLTDDVAPPIPGWWSEEE